MWYSVDDVLFLLTKIYIVLKIVRKNFCSIEYMYMIAFCCFSE